ncbi:hypothetical protein MMC28_007199 [Mycoblastus sanguinarius]|nr:hypothetical protein [Mycoblastus sanguinarius]
MDPPDLRSDFKALIRYASGAPKQYSLADGANTAIHSSDNGGFSPQGNERFKNLIDGIQFSKRFILSYQFVLLGLLLVFAAVHWVSRFRAWRRRTRRYSNNALERNQDTMKSISEIQVVERLEDSSSGSSSSSSTLGEGYTPKHPDSDEREDERSPLLIKPVPTSTYSRRSVLISSIRAWLVYQPRPIPIVNKTLPSNGTTLIVLAFIGLQVFYVFFRTPLSLSMLFVFADRTSLVFVANLPLLYLFAAKNQPIKTLTGYSYESLNVLHRRLGELMCLLALFHSAGMIGVWYTLLRPAGVELVKFLLMKMILLGIGAFAAYELIYFTSLGTFRQRWYELFLGLHVILQVAALILVWFHHRGSRLYVGVALGIFLIDRLVYRMSIKINTLRASLEVKEDKETVLLSTNVPRRDQGIFPSSVLSYVFGTSIRGGWKPTEHIFLTVAPLARKHIIQAHPFTIASPARSVGEKDASLELIIRAQDGFSGDLVRYAKAHDSTTIRLDGPYGSQSAVELLQDSDHAVIVAGGSGIAVAWPLVWSVIEEACIQDLENSACPTNRKQILFVWVMREKSHISWLGDDKLRQLQARGVTLMTLPPTAEYGHPDISRIIGLWIERLNCQNTLPNVGVVVSGPDGMNRAVRNTCAFGIKRGKNISVEVEKFGW